MFGQHWPGKQPDNEVADREEQPGPAEARNEGGGARPPWRRIPRKWAIVAGLATAAVVIAAVTVALTGSSSNRLNTQASTPIAAGPIRVESTTPAPGATNVNGTADIAVNFSEPVAARSPVPALHPSVPGTWAAVGDSMVFAPSAPFAQSTTVTLTIPGGQSGVRSNGGGLLAHSVTEQFTTGTYSQTRLAQILAQLGYLPLKWSPAANGPTRAEAAIVGQASQSQAALAYAPPPGTFTWKARYPATLTSQWNPNQGNELLTGAVMAFESEHGMSLSGNLTPRLWSALFTALARNQQNKNGYSYAVARKSIPETLTIWHNGRQVLQSLANTGISDAPTVDGTFPVFEKFTFQIMRGTNPDGSQYADPVSWVSYFNGGDAVHYFDRGSYGWPQSLGCVELPYNEAKSSYPYLTYGTLVTVTG